MRKVFEKAGVERGEGPRRGVDDGLRAALAPAGLPWVGDYPVPWRNISDWLAGWT